MSIFRRAPPPAPSAPAPSGPTSLSSQAFSPRQREGLDEALACLRALHPSDVVPTFIAALDPPRWNQSRQAIGELRRQHRAALVAAPELGAYLALARPNGNDVVSCYAVGEAASTLGELRDLARAYTRADEADACRRLAHFLDTAVQPLLLERLADPLHAGHRGFVTYLQGATEDISAVIAALQRFLSAPFPERLNDGALTGWHEYTRSEAVRAVGTLADRLAKHASQAPAKAASARAAPSTATAEALPPAASTPAEGASGAATPTRAVPSTSNADEWLLGWIGGELATGSLARIRSAASAVRRLGAGAAPLATDLMHALGRLVGDSAEAQQVRDELLGALLSLRPPSPAAARPTATFERSAGRAKCHELLAQLALCDLDPEVRAEAVSHLAEIGYADRSTFAAAYEAAKADEPAVRRAAVRLLSALAGRRQFDGPDDEDAY